MSALTKDAVIQTLAESGGIPEDKVRFIFEQAVEFVKARAVEVEYLESGTFQGGEEDCFLKGVERGSTCYAYSPDAVPWTSEDDV